MYLLKWPVLDSSTREAEAEAEAGGEFKTNLVYKLSFRQPGLLIYRDILSLAWGG